MNCSDCGLPIDTQPNGRDPLCHECRLLRRQERSRAWKDNNPERRNEINRNNYHERKYRQQPRHTHRPQRGVIVYYKGNAYPDHYTKTQFLKFIQAGLIKSGFVSGDIYQIDGKEYAI
jgi:hypothetical protein